MTSIYKAKAIQIQKLRESEMRNILLGLTVLSATAIWAAEKIQPLNVKTGLWETTLTLTRAGEMPIPAGLLAKLSPEQRAKFEARMKANAGSKTTTTTHRSCETTEKLDKAPFSNEKQCSETVLTSTSSKAEVKVTCDYGEMKASGTLKIEALSSESVKGSGEMTATGSGNTMNSATSFTGKWLSSSCGDLK
jgi:hypothetical protein